MRTLAVEIIRAYSQVGKQVFDNRWVKAWMEAQALSKRCRLCQFQLEGQPDCSDEMRKKCDEQQLTINSSLVK